MAGTMKIKAFGQFSWFHFFCFIFLFNLFYFQLAGQQNQFDTDLLSPSFHQDRRDTLRKLLPENSCAILLSNPLRNRSNDVDFQYSQDPDFYYLTGLVEPNSLVIIFKSPVDIDGTKTNELIFVQERDPESEKWNGIRLGIPGVKKLGFETVMLNRDFENFSFPRNIDRILVKFPTDIRETGRKPGINWLVSKLKSKIEALEKEAEILPLIKILASLREIKKPEELLLLQKAVDISMEGLKEAIRAIEPGMKEYQAQSIVEFYFQYRGAEYPGYGSIAGSGLNSCILHYTTNRKTLREGDMIVMDMGAEYHGYTADITRSVPVNGKFTAEQKQIYDLVLKAQLDGIQKSRPGNSFYDPHKAAMDIITGGLLELGIIRETSEARRYFNHGTSHYLGLEVHDPGTYGQLKPGMVITVEPGVYIPENSPCDKKWWNIGIRIEDDILITEGEPVVMSGALPKSWQEIEKIMAEKSLFNTIK